MASSEHAQSNQMISKFYARCMQVILESRIPTFTSCSSRYGEGSSSTPGPGAKGSWFNLVLGNFGPVIEKMEPWCLGVWEPMVIDILFLQPGKNRPMEPWVQKTMQGERNLSVCGFPGTGLTVSGSERPILLERWTVQFSGPSLKSSAKAKIITKVQECKGASKISSQQQRGTCGYKPMVAASTDHGGRGRSVGKTETAAAIPLQAVYKRMMILLRSLYCTARLLPAQSLFRLLCASYRCKFSLSYSILASPPPLPESIKKDMIHHFFTPIESHGGHMCVSVAYQPAVPAAAHETPPLLPQIIADYVDSAATIRSKQFSNERDLCLHSAPTSDQRSPSIESYKLRQLQSSNKKMAPGDGEGRATVRPRVVSMKSSDFTDVQDEELECPFAVEQHHRMESPRLMSVKSDGRFSNKISDGGAVGSGVTLLRSAAPPSGAQQQDKDNVLLLQQHKKTVTDALKELKLYIEFRDSIPK